MELEEHCYSLHGVVLRVKCDLVSKMLSTVSGTEQVLSSSISASVGITINVVY